MSLLLRLIILLVGSIFYASIFGNSYFRAVTLMQMEILWSLFFFIFFIPVITGLLAELAPFARKYQISWGQFIVVLILILLAFLLFSPLGIPFWGLQMWTNAQFAYPLVGVLLGISLGKALVENQSL